MWNLAFFINAIAFGAGLAMDAFSVSLVRGLCEPHMRKLRLCLIVGVFSFFQFFMPMTGWFFVHNLAQAFASFQKYIPYIALILLLFIGGKMLLEGFGGEEEKTECPLKPIGFGALILQGIATSIDALSVGVTIADFSALQAFVYSLIIAVVTFAICTAGVLLGKKFGTRLAGKATILGGVILIGIGIEIFVTGVFF